MHRRPSNSISLGHYICQKKKKTYLDRGIKTIMLPKSVLATIVLLDASIFVITPSHPVNISSAGSLYVNDPYKKHNLTKIK
jgi:hypothetical protein